MIHTDGIKPLIVEDAMQREVDPQDAAQEFRAMNYGAWRACSVLRESVQGAAVPMSADQIVVIIGALELTYEGLYRASQ